MRLDFYVKAKLCSSRTKAQEAIESGNVFINGKVAQKSSQIITQNDNIEIHTQGLLLGRAGYKLRAFLAQLKIQEIIESVQNMRVIDIGSSTGGFTQVMLEQGVREIVCVDVGKMQLHDNLRTDSRVQVFEECDVREFHDELGFDLLLCDVSFISLHNLLPSLEKLACARNIWLFKPQFEVGKEVKRNKKGVIKDNKHAQKALENFIYHSSKKGFQTILVELSALKGKEGNEEYFIYAQYTKPRF